LLWYQEEENSYKPDSSISQLDISFQRTTSKKNIYINCDIARHRAEKKRAKIEGEREQNLERQIYKTHAYIAVC